MNTAWHGVKELVCGTRQAQAEQDGTVIELRRSTETRAMTQPEGAEEGWENLSLELG